MAKRTKSGLKRKRQDLKRGVRNQAIRSKVKTLVKEARTAEQPGGDTLRAAIAALDAAARKGIMHPNAAARKKSRLMRWAGARPQAAATA